MRATTRKRRANCSANDSDRRHANSQRKIPGPGDQPAQKPACAAHDRLRQGEPLQRAGQPARFRGVRRARPLCRHGVDQLRIRLARRTERHGGRDQRRASRFHPPDGRTAGDRKLLPCQGQRFPLPEKLRQAVRRDLLRRPLRPGGQRTGREAGPGTRAAPSGRHPDLRTFEKNGFFGSR